MKGYRFYADNGGQRSKAASKKHGPFTRATLKALAEIGGRCNCIAVVLLDEPESARPRLYPSGGQTCAEAFVALLGTSNSPVNFSGVAMEYLDKHCVRIDEALARKLHPALFARLDD